MFFIFFALTYNKIQQELLDSNPDVRIYTISHSGSNRFYIGATRKSLDARLRNHKYRSKHKYKLNKTLSFKERWLIDAINNNYDIFIEELDVVKFSEFSFWERYYISLFKHFGFKLTNGTEGGDGVWTRRATEEEKEKLRLLKMKPVVEYNSDGRIINKYKSLQDASIETGLSSSRIGHAACGRINLCNGRMFRYESINVSKEDINKCFKTRNTEKRKPVYQYDLNGNFVNEYVSASHTPFRSQTIAATCRGEKKTAYNYIWKYKNDQNGL